ncbi:mucin-2-like [Panonychus citri]|uniref:mucin-2-like n=1 Tax=Panonychus citri TaxID=50023 RepID=UPI00230827BE|nr:mucin-2-like [Panonychus citri]
MRLIVICVFLIQLTSVYGMFFDCYDFWPWNFMGFCHTYPSFRVTTKIMSKASNSTKTGLDDSSKSNNTTIEVNSTTELPTTGSTTVQPTTETITTTLIIMTTELMNNSVTTPQTTTKTEATTTSTTITVPTTTTTATPEPTFISITTETATTMASTLETTTQPSFITEAPNTLITRYEDVPNVWPSRKFSNKFKDIQIENPPSEPDSVPTDQDSPLDEPNNLVTDNPNKWRGFGGFGPEIDHDDDEDFKPIKSVDKNKNFPINYKNRFSK